MCNCRKKEDYPLNGECMVDEVVYQATVTTETTQQKHTSASQRTTSRQGMGTIRSVSFSHEKRKSETELSKHIWQLKGENKEFKVTWKILAKAKPYTNITKRCDLCNTEKFFLICRPHMATLNKRNELISTCRHRRKFILRFSSARQRH